MFIIFGGELRFFEITKDAVIDHPHTAADYNNSISSDKRYTDKAGDFPKTSSDINLGEKNMVK